MLVVQALPCGCHNVQPAALQGVRCDRWRTVLGLAGRHKWGVVMARQAKHPLNTMRRASTLSVPCNAPAPTHRQRCLPQLYGVDAAATLDVGQDEAQPAAIRGAVVQHLKWW